MKRVSWGISEWLIIDLEGCQKVLLPSLTTTCCWTMSVVLDPAQNGRMRWGLNLCKMCKMTHAASSRFLDRVRRRLEGRPQDYSDFLNIMRVNSLLVQFIEWPENKAQTHPSILGAEVRIFEHKLCHRGDLSPVSGNFNPAQIPNWLQ